MKRNQHLTHPGLEPLWKSIERDWLLQLLALLIFILFGLLFIAGGLAGYLLLLVLGSVISSIVGYHLYRHLTRPTVLDRLLEMLYESPENIVWIYTIVNEHHPFGLQFFQRGILYFKLADGDEISAHLPPHKLKLICKILSRALPDTVFGYNNERARRYSQDPRSLKDAG